MDPTDTELATAAIELPPTGEAGEAPEWILLLPAGDLVARDGRRWRHGDPQAVLAASRQYAGGSPMVIDYEHQTDQSARNGQAAPAAGWIREFALRDGALWGRAEWTARATSHITAREYRFISPVFLHDRAGQVRSVHRASLTNTPALPMPALAKSQGAIMDHIDLDAIAAALGMTPGSTLDQVVSEAKQRSAGPPLASIATAFGLHADATEADIIACASATATAAKAPDPSEFVPRDEFDRVATALTQMQSDQTMARATAAVDAAIAGGRVAPAQRDWAIGYARTDLEGFDKFISLSPALLAPGALPGLGGAPKGGKDGLDDQQLAVCNALGITPQAYAESDKEINARGF